MAPEGLGKNQFFQKCDCTATLPVLVVTRSVDLSFNVLGDELKKVSSRSRERSGRTGARRGDSMRPALPPELFQRVSRSSKHLARSVSIAGKDE
jgi:hypothetical protein